MTKDEVVAYFLEMGFPPPKWKVLVIQRGNRYRLVDWLMDEPTVAVYLRPDLDSPEDLYELSPNLSLLKEGERLAAVVEGCVYDVWRFPEAYLDPQKVVRVLEELGVEDEELLELILEDPLAGFDELEAREDLLRRVKEHPAWEEILEEAEKVAVLAVLEEQGFLSMEEEEAWLEKYGLPL